MLSAKQTHWMWVMKARTSMQPRSLISLEEQTLFTVSVPLLTRLVQTGIVGEEGGQGTRCVPTRQLPCFGLADKES